MSTLTISRLNYACGRSRSTLRYLSDFDSHSSTSKLSCPAEIVKLIVGCAGTSRISTAPTFARLERTVSERSRLLLHLIQSFSRVWCTWPISSFLRRTSSRTQRKRTRNDHWCSTRFHMRSSRIHLVSRESCSGESSGSSDTTSIRQRSRRHCSHHKLRPSRRRQDRSRGKIYVNRQSRGPSISNQCKLIHL